MPSIKLTNLLLAVTIASRTNGTSPAPCPLPQGGALAWLMRPVKRTYKFVGFGLTSFDLSPSLKAPAAGKETKKPKQKRTSYTERKGRERVLGRACWEAMIDLKYAKNCTL